MPITTEEEPEDIDDEAPSRVSVNNNIAFNHHSVFSSLLSGLSMDSLIICHPAKFFQLSVLLSCNTLLHQTLPTVGVPYLLLALSSRAAAST